MTDLNRRDFFRTTLAGIAGLHLAGPGEFASSYFSRITEGSKVAITTGENRADMAFRALQPFSNEIKQAIGKRRVVLKPNNVLIYVPLACTHVDTLEGILEFLKSINKLKNVIIAESSASAPTLEGFDNYGYFSLLSKYPVKLVDLDAEPFENLYVADEKDFRPHLVKVSGIMLDPDSYVVSVARMKTHNTVGVSLSLKNIVIGSPIKDHGFTLYNEDKRFSASAKESKPGTVSYKRLLHGSGYHAINYNLSSLAQKLFPDLALIDGYQGMEGNGPTLGTPVDHRVCVASPDWLAADRVCTELMGIDFTKIGYLTYCCQMGMGEGDINKIGIIGEAVKDHQRTYKLPDNFGKQADWMNPLSQ